MGGAAVSTGFDRAAWVRLATLFDGAPGPACKRCGGDGEQLSEVARGGSCTCGTCRGAGFTERVPYAGYKPAVHEAPNGDTKACPECKGNGSHAETCNAHGSLGCLTCHAYSACGTCPGDGRVPNVDAGPAGKRYLHVAEKYLAQHPGLDWPRVYLARAYYEICRVADALHVPDAYYPRPEDTTLRVLEYPSAACEYHGVITGNGHWRCVTCGHKQMASPGGPSARVCPALAHGAGTAEHTDPNLFTIVCWRETPADLEITLDTRGAPAEQRRVVQDAMRLSTGLHIGQIGELVGLGPATPHRVPARPYVQRSIVAFAMPRLDAGLSVPVHHVCERGELCSVAGCTVSGRTTVREWIEAWKKRGRVYT